MTKTLDVGLIGANGRMGREIVRALNTEPHAKLSVAVTSPHSEDLGLDVAEVADLPASGIALTANIREALEHCDVMIDFSSPQAAIDAALSMHTSRCHTLITGTTGYSHTEEAALIKAAESITLLRSGNFSLGVNMLEALVELASARLQNGWDIEVLEMHHKHKVDAPSGTALMLGEAAAKGRNITLKDNFVLSREGRTLARQEGQIGFASLRGGGVVGQHEVRIASELEMLTLSHEALDRSVFAKGAVSAALWAADKPKGLYDMKDVLGL